MAEKPKKKKTARKKRGTYEDKTVVKGTFLDIIKSAVKHADKKKKENDS